MGGDGSGGEHTKDPRIRKCRFGLVVLEPQQVAGDCSNDPEILSYASDLVNCGPGATEQWAKVARDCSKVAGDRSKLIPMVSFGSVPGAWHPELISC